MWLTIFDITLIHILCIYRERHTHKLMLMSALIQNSNLYVFIPVTLLNDNFNDKQKKRPSFISFWSV